MLAPKFDGDRLFLLGGVEGNLCELGIRTDDLKLDRSAVFESPLGYHRSLSWVAGFDKERMRADFEKWH